MTEFRLSMQGRSHVPVRVIHLANYPAHFEYLLTRPVHRIPLLELLGQQAVDLAAGHLLQTSSPGILTSEHAGAFVSIAVAADTQDNDI